MVAVIPSLLGLFATERARRWALIGGGMLLLWLWSQWWIAGVEERAQRELEIYLAKKAADVNREVREYERELNESVGDDVGAWYADQLQRGWAAQPFAGRVLGKGICGDPGTLPDCAPPIP